MGFGKHVSWDPKVQTFQGGQVDTRFAYSASSSSSQSYVKSSKAEAPTPSAPYMSTKPLPVEISDAIKRNSTTCLKLDLSLSSKHIGPLINEHRNRSACEPQLQEIQVILPGNRRKINVHLKKGDPGYLTVGRVMGDVHSYFRQQLQETASSGITQTFEKRLETSTLDTRPGLRPSHIELKEKERLITEERNVGPRNVDTLRGYTTFAGFSVLEDGVWELHLEPCRRYIR